MYAFMISHVERAKRVYYCEFVMRRFRFVKEKNRMSQYDYLIVGAGLTGAVFCT